MCDFVVFVTELYRRVVKMATAEFLCLKLYRVCEILETLLDKDVVEQIVITKLDRMRELIDELKDPDAKAAKEAYEKKWAEFWDKVVDVLAKKQRPAPVASTVVLPTKSDSEELPRKAVPEAVEATISGLSLEKAKETQLEKCRSEDAVAEIVDAQVSPVTVVKENESCGLRELNDFLENRDRGPSKESSDKWSKESIIRFGVPKEWTADRGLQFESKEFKEFVNGLGIKHNFGAAYQRRTSEMIKGWNGSGELLRSCPGEEEWDAKLPKVLATYGTFPFEVVFVLQPSLELDAKFGTEASAQATVDETSQVKERLTEAATQMKLGYVKRAKPARKLDGRRVHWRVPSRKTRLQATFKGPFIAERTHHPWSYRIEGASRASKVVHVNQLKCCFNDDVALVTLQTRGWLLSTNGGVVVLSQRSD